MVQSTLSARAKSITNHASWILLVCLVLSGSKGFAQTSAFSYQGRLTDGGAAANGNYDLQFTLWDTLSGGTQQPVASPVTVTKSAVPVSGGIFMVQLDFGVSALPGADRFLEIGVRSAGGSTFTILSPRQQITPTPYAIRTLSATTADGLSSACASCVQDININSVAGNKVSGAIPVAAVPGGSANYIQNSTPQAGSSFNISGDGTAGGTVSANVVNAVIQYNLSGSQVLREAPSGNLFVGFGAAGAFAVQGADNTLVGFNAGLNNLGGFSNSFFGSGAGKANSNGAFNSFFGYSAGSLNVRGDSNSFFGNSAGRQVTGDNNTFVGAFAGDEGASPNSGSGSQNTIIGANSGFPSDQIGDFNTMIGFGVEGAAGITNATAIGANARVTQSNSLVLGSIKGHGFSVSQGDTMVGIGTTAPSATLNVVGPAADSGASAPPVLSIVGGRGGGGINGGAGSSVTIQAGDGADGLNSGGTGGSIFVLPGAGGGGSNPGARGALDVEGKALVRGLGTFANNLGAADLQIGYGLASANTAGSVTRLALQPYGYQTGPWKFVARDDATTAYLDWVYGASLTGITQDSNGNVGVGANNPAVKLQVRGDIRVGISAFNGGCVQKFDGTAIAGTCSSDIRFKRNITPFPNLLNKLTQLRPVNYYWRSAAFPEKHFGDGQSYGLVAQEVERVLPELVGEDEQGYKTVDYSKLPLMLLQAVKELRAENDSLRQQNTEITARLEKIEQRLQRNPRSRSRLRRQSK